MGGGAGKVTVYNAIIYPLFVRFAPPFSDKTASKTKGKPVMLKYL
jgi:hypothetical protein